MKIRLTLLLLFVASYSSYSQTEAERIKIIAQTNVAELNRMAPMYDSIFKSQKLEALRWAAIKG